MRLCVCLTLIVLVGLWGRISAQSMSSVVKDLHWNPVDGNEIAIAYGDGRIAVENLTTQTQQIIFTPQTTFSGIFAKVSWHPQGQFLAAGVGNTIYIWQRSGTLFQIYHQLLVGSADGIAHLESGNTPESITALDWSYDGNFLGMSSLTGVVKVLIRTDTQIAFSSSYLDAQPIAWASHRNVVLVGTQSIDFTGSAPQITNIPVGVSVLTTIAWKSDDSFFTFGDVYGFISIVNALQPQTTKIYRPFLGDSAPSITDVAWLDSQNKVVETDTEGRFVILNAATGAIDYVAHHDGPLYTVDVDPSGTKIAYGGESSSGQDTGFSIISVSSVLPGSVLVATPSNTSDSTAQPSDVQALREMLFPANCTQACFFGMQPGITTREEFEVFLDQNRLVPHILFPESPDDTQYQWDLPAQTAFQSQGRGETFFIAGKMTYLVLTLDIPLSVVYEVFGYPDRVKTYEGWIILHYETLGVDIVVTQASNLSRTLFVSLAAPHSKHQSYIGYLPSEPVDQPCSTYGTFPCVAPTATPGPINDSRSTSAAQSSDALILQNLLTSPGCVGACYWGLEPLITTRQQAEGILAAHGINNYEMEIPYSGDIEDSSYYWEDASFPLREPYKRFRAMFAAGSLHQVFLPIRVSEQVVIEAFGNPDQVVMALDGPGAIYSFIYLAKGITFRIDAAQHMTKDVILASAVSPYRNAVNWTPGDLVEQPCTTYGSLPCIVPTATPLSK
jgi:WD40 repeat protein